MSPLPRFNRSGRAAGLWPLSGRPRRSRLRQRHPRHRHRGERLLLPLALVALLLLLLELGLRLLGLGRPPLLMPDRLMEYRFRPNQQLWRFGHRIAINTWGMRSPALAPQPLAGRPRLLVLGDSIVWGGAETDQDHIAASRLQQLLGSSWEVANLGTPSWGPANWLGAVQRLGLFGSQRVLLVISSHDAEDDPTYDPLQGNPETPTQNPPLALLELGQRYLWPRVLQRLPQLGGSTANATLPGLASPTPPSTTPPSTTPPSTTPPSPDERLLEPRSPALASAAGSAVPFRFDTPLRRTHRDPRHPLRPLDTLLPLPALDALVSAIRARGAELVVLQHWERGELEGDLPYPGHDRIRAVLLHRRVPITQAGPIMRRCAAAHGQPIAALYVDQIHPYTDLGQLCLAEAMAAALRSAPPPTAPPTATPTAPPTPLPKPPLSSQPTPRPTPASLPPR